jgi:hypothetical protein
VSACAASHGLAFLSLPSSFPNSATSVGDSKSKVLLAAVVACVPA